MLEGTIHADRNGLFDETTRLIEKEAFIARQDLISSCKQEIVELSILARISLTFFFLKKTSSFFFLPKSPLDTPGSPSADIPLCPPLVTFHIS